MMKIASIAHKKDRECWILNKFLSRIKLDTLNIFSGEKPDFLIEIENRQIGVEITEFTAYDGGNNHSERKQDDFRKKIQTEINSKIEKSRRIEASFRKINKHHKNAAIDIIESLPSNLSHQGYVSLSDKAQELLYYMRVEPGTNNRGGFYYMQSYNLQPLLDIKRLQEIIKEKEKRFNSYKKYSENWLLIAFDRTEPAHDQCLDVPLQELSSLSPNQFDRVFLYRTYESDPIMITKSKGAIRLVGDDYVVF